MTVVYVEVSSARDGVDHVDDAVLGEDIGRRDARVVHLGAAFEADGDALVR